MDDTRLLHLKNLMTIAFADGVLDPMEKEFIIEKASMLGIEEKELNKMFKEALNLKQKIVQIQSDGVKTIAETGSSLNNELIRYNSEFSQLVRQMESLNKRLITVSKNLKKWRRK